MRRRKICALLMLFVMLATALAGTDAAAPETAKVKPYAVSPTLREVVNLRAFSRVRALSPAERRLLAQNLFVAAPTTQKQLFHVYEDNDYRDLPSFVTTDAVLHLYHIFYDFTLRTVEEQSLAPVLRRMTEGMLEDSVKTMRELSDPQLKQAALKNTAYFAVALRLLDPQASVPAEASAIVQTELDLIKEHEGFKVGAIFPYLVDYSQFNPRGHYTRSEALKHYFGTMMWYGLTPFAVRTNEGLSEEQIRQSLLLTR